MYAAVDVGNISPWERYESVAQHGDCIVRHVIYADRLCHGPLAEPWRVRHRRGLYAGGGFILALGWLLSFDMWIILGMACGALAGLSVGVMQFRKFMSEYREIME